MCNILEHMPRTAVESCNQSRIVQSSRSAKSDADSRGPADEVSERNKVSISNWPRGHPCGYSAKNLVAFCPCTKNLLEQNLNVMD